MRTRMRRDLGNFHPLQLKIAGIDPGLEGAVCKLSGAKCDIFDIPIFLIERGGKNKRDIDAHILSEILKDIDHAFLEQVGSTPQMGVSSSFAFGKGYGIVLGILAANKIPFTLVTPQKWKKHMRVPRSKDGARQRASQLLPSSAGQWMRVKDDGRAEAALIALYGRQVINEV